MTDLRLLSMAADAMQYSYSPYSHFKVGAALLCSDGSVYTGANIENGAYSATVCAERTAFFKAISEGKKQFTTIAIVGGNIEKPCYPCGVCRQVMSEFCDENFEILLLKDGEIIKHTLSELLPHSFKL